MGSRSGTAVVALSVWTVLGVFGLSVAACAYSPPMDDEPHAKLRILLTSDSGNFLEAEIAIDSQDVEEQLLATGRFNVAPGAHSMKVKLLSARRTVGKVRKVYGLTQRLARDVKMEEVRRCSGGIKFRATAGKVYEFHIATTGAGTTCLIECAEMVSDADGTLRRTSCPMTRRY